MTLGIRVKFPVGTLQDCTEGRIYPVDRVIKKGCAYRHNGTHRVAAPSDGFIIRDDVGVEVALSEDWNLTYERWELVNI